MLFYTEVRSKKLKNVSCEYGHGTIEGALNVAIQQ